MNISIKSTNIELTPALRDYTEKRMRSITKFTKGEPTVSVEIGKTTAHHKQGDVFIAEVIVVTPLGKQFMASSEKSDLYEAIDDVRNEIARELSSDKDKRVTLFRRGAKKVKWMLRGFRD
jgi:putative sigma-54 modulation protein